MPHSTHKPPQEAPAKSFDINELPLTINTVIKWTGIVFTLISALISIVWFAAILKGDIISLQQEVASMKREEDIRNAQQDKDIDKLKDRADSTDKAVAELGRKLDVAVTILERIDKKVGAN